MKLISIVLISLVLAGSCFAADPTLLPLVEVETFTCKRHGEIDSWNTFIFSLPYEGTEKVERIVYCFRCIVENLDKYIGRVEQ